MNDLAQDCNNSIANPLERHLPIENKLDLQMDE